MSLLSLDLAAPQRVALLPGRAGLAAPGRPAAAQAAQGADPWRAALDALGGLLGAARGGGGAAVTLSHHFVRLFLLDAPPTWLRRGEMAGWVAERLAEPLGGGAWRHAWPVTPPGRPVPVCALAEERAAELHDLLTRHGRRLARLRPWLDQAWQRRHRRLARASGWYALVEPGSISLLRLERGQLRGLRQRQYPGEAVAELAGLLHREALLAGIAPQGEVWLERAGVNDDWQRLGQAWRLHELAGPTDSLMAMLQ